MANSFSTTPEKYLPILDEIYKKGSLTSNLDTASPNFVDTKTVRIFNIGMDGLGDYSRENGYVDGSVTGAWETYTLTKDRGRSFSVDYLDNNEQLDMVMMHMVSEFMRTKVVPELDAYRFAKMAGSAGLSGTAGTLSSSNKVLAALDTAFMQMGDNEVPLEGMVCYMSEAAYMQIKSEVTRELGNESAVAHAVASYEGVPIIRVPAARFNTAVTLSAGATSGTPNAGGFAPTAGGFPINFMLVHPSSLIQVVKHEVPRLFNPNENQKANAWKFDYRIHHDCFVKTNKAKGIYLHASATANS